MSQAITFIGENTYTASVGPLGIYDSVSLTSLTGGAGTTALEDDIVFVLCTNGYDSDINFILGTSGYTKIADLYYTDLYDVNLGLFYKVMGSTPDTEVRVPRINSDAGTANIIRVYRYVDTSNPFDVTTTTAVGRNSARPDPAAITPITAGALILATGGYGAESVASRGNFTASDLTNFTSFQSTDEVFESCAGFGDKEWTSGSFDPARWSLTGDDGTAYSWASATVALRPAFPPTSNNAIFAFGGM